LPHKPPTHTTNKPQPHPPQKRAEPRAQQCASRFAN